MRRIQLDESAVVAMYESVENAREVAAAFGCSDQTIYRVLERNCIKRTHRHDKVDRQKTLVSNCRSKYCPALMVMLHEILGLTARQISEVTGYKQNAIRNALTRRGVSTDVERVCANDFDIGKIEREYRNGVSTYSLEEKYGVNHATISKWMRKRGVRRIKGCCSPHEVKCRRCGKSFVATRYNQTYCSKTCINMTHWRRRYDKSRVGGKCADISLAEVYKRDKGKCYICGNKTDWNDYYIKNGHKICGNRYPSREHVIALNNGGTHTLDNIRLACRGCNSLKSDKGQMRLAI